MELLRDLKKLAEEVVQNYNDKFDSSDCKIPQAFKDHVKKLKSFSIVYNEYSVIIKGDGIRSKDSYVPNQCFYMASFFIEYSHELSKYKQKIIPWITSAGITDLTSFFTRERVHGKEDVINGNDEFVSILDSIDYKEADRDYLIKFVTDYDWWSGSKTIDRSDFFNSPVLSIMGLTAASNAAMALIVDYLTQNPDDSKLLLNQVDNNKQVSTSTVYNKIFYGAPGTGKSHKIKEEVDDKGKQNFRITFHPDSDYSTFVGAYKPTMKENIITKNGVETKEEQIVYRFVPQAFTKAYTAAWNTEEDVYLIIEEINRGNCAQIFGDLFQLLDRKNGMSQYSIDADTDLADYLEKELKDSARPDFPMNVKEGKKLILPNNLYIWATMNTSDQSLFPIDSAFKRRWDWKYMKIKNHPDKDYKIKLSDEEFDWWNFIKKINEIIASITSSADKQLGYFFCKADTEGKIKAETFVAKVIFYLWNDVFKDYGFEDTSLFTYMEMINGKEETRELTFPDFYDEEGEKVNETRLKDFIYSVLDWKKKNEDSN